MVKQRVPPRIASKLPRLSASSYEDQHGPTDWWLKGSTHHGNQTPPCHNVGLKRDWKQQLQMILPTIYQLYMDICTYSIHIYISWYMDIYIMIYPSMSNIFAVPLIRAVKAFGPAGAKRPALKRRALKRCFCMRSFDGDKRKFQGGQVVFLGHLHLSNIWI